MGTRQYATLAMASIIGFVCGIFVQDIRTKTERIEAVTTAAVLSDVIKIEITDQNESLIETLNNVSLDSIPLDTLDLNRYCNKKIYYYNH